MGAFRAGGLLARVQREVQPFPGHHAELRPAEVIAHHASQQRHVRHFLRPGDRKADGGHVHPVVGDGRFRGGGFRLREQCRRGQRNGHGESDAGDGGSGVGHGGPLDDGLVPGTNASKLRRCRARGDPAEVDLRHLESARPRAEAAASRHRHRRGPDSWGIRARLSGAANKGRIACLPEERCNRLPACQARGNQNLEPRSLNRDPLTGDECLMHPSLCPGRSFKESDACMLSTNPPPSPISTLPT